MDININDLYNKNFLKNNAIQILLHSSRYENRFSNDEISSEQMYNIFDNVLSMKNSYQREENKYNLIVEILDKVSRSDKDRNKKFDNEILLLKYLDSRRLRLLRDNSLLSLQNWAVMRLNYEIFFKQNNNGRGFEVVPYIYQKNPELRDFIKNVLIKAIIEETNRTLNLNIFLKYNEDAFKMNFSSFLEENPLLLSPKMVIGTPPNINFRPALYKIIEGVKESLGEEVLKKVYKGISEGIEIQKENVLFIQLLNFLNENNDNMLNSKFLKTMPLIKIEYDATDENFHSLHDKKTINEMLNKRNSNLGNAFVAYLEKENIKNKLSLNNEDNTPSSKKRL